MQGLLQIGIPQNSERGPPQCPLCKKLFGTRPCQLEGDGGKMVVCCVRCFTLVMTISRMVHAGVLRLQSERGDTERGVTGAEPDDGTSGM